MLRSLLLFVFCSLSVVCARSQPGALSAAASNPVKWTFSVEQKEGSDEATVLFKASIGKGWHIYPITMGGDEIGLPTTFTIKQSKDFDLLGGMQEGKPISKEDQVLKITQRYFEKNATFKQKIKINSGKDFKLSGSLEFIACLEDGQCLPPEVVDYSITIKGIAGAVATTANASTTENPSKTAEDSGSATAAVSTETSPSYTPNDQSKSIISESMKPEQPERSKWGIFIEGLLGGFAALLMPCIFPMLPLTVSYFTKKGQSKSKAIGTATVYGLSIIFLYVALGMGITLAFGASALNTLASEGWFNFIFFVILVVFAASFFGAFEITLPSWIVSKSTENEEKGGLIGIFFMAVTLSVVSFSCTGPIIGTLLVDAASKGELFGPAIGMFGFSLALAIPFALFAAFPSWLNSLPKSGGWLNSVKVVLGFLELALALKFLSNVDLAYHLNILDREVFLVLWIVIFAMLGFYLLGKLKFSHDSDLKFISIPRLFFAIISLSFALYMVPGLWGAPLKAISAFSPPQHTQDFDLTTMELSSSSEAKAAHVPKKYEGKFHCPHGLDCFFDYEEALAYANKMGKPLFIDFTGHTCVNCRRMEVAVWSDKEVLKRLKNDYVMVSLYVDDRTPLATEDQFVSKVTGKKVATLGNKWAELQESRFKTQSQPYYVLLDNKGDVLNTPRAYDQDVEKYIKFLDEGKAEYEVRKSK